MKKDTPTRPRGTVARAFRPGEAGRGMLPTHINVYEVEHPDDVGRLVLTAFHFTTPQRPGPPAVTVHDDLATLCAPGVIR